MNDGEDGLRESWIDDSLGHEGNNKSVGNTVYFDDVDIANLLKVAESVQYPCFWNTDNRLRRYKFYFLATTSLQCKEFCFYIKWKKHQKEKIH